MKNILLLSLYLVFMNSCKGQDITSKDELYMVMCASRDVRTQYPYYIRSENGVDSIILNLLWRVESDSLKLVDTLNYNCHLNSETHLFRHFDEYHWFFIREQEYRTEADIRNLSRQFDEAPKEGLFFSVLDYSGDELILRKVDSKYLKPFGANWSHNNAFYFNGNLYYDYSGNLSSKYFGNFITNRKFDNSHRIEEEVFLNKYYCKSESGILFRGGNYGYPFGKDGKLKFSWEKAPFDEWSDASFQIPTSVEDGIQYANFQIKYTSPKSAYLIGQKYDFEGNADRSNLHYILTKTTSVWDSIYLPKYCREFNVYGDELLYGTGINEACMGQNDRCFTDSIEQFKILYPDKYSERYGFHPFVPRMYGSIWMYHIPSKRYVEYRAEDRDIEFIQIIDGWIYYRVYDELRRMRLNMAGSYFDKDTIEVLVKDKYVVPHVHHVFFAPRVDRLMVEWITPNPNAEQQSLEKKRNK